MIVQIKRCSNRKLWYFDRIGDSFIVNDNYELKSFEADQIIHLLKDDPRKGLSIRESDCEILIKKK